MIKFAQLFLSLTILITLHEFGHFYFAKRFKTRVDKFYLFFDFLFPFANILNFSLLKKKIGDTTYGLGWFPFGGYVQIAGMVDEQMDKDSIGGEPQPWELRSKPAYQRLLIMMGGIIVNVLLGIFIFWMVLLGWGKETIPMNKLQYGITCDSIALDMGFRNGDFIKSIDDKPVTSLNRVPISIVLEKAEKVQIVRNGKPMDIAVSEENIGAILKNLKHSPFIGVRIPTEIDSVTLDGNAIKSGLKKGDRIIGVDEKQTLYFDEFKSEIQKAAGKTVTVVALRGKDTMRLNTLVSDEGTLGFFNATEKFIPFETKNYGLFSALTQGIADGWESIVMQIKTFKVIFTVKDAHKQVGGFYSMYKSMKPTWDWHNFWTFTAFLSLVLAFMNFLPIPMLDGGYILFILIEMVSRRKVSEKVIYYANYVGLFMILGLMIYANTDWLRD